MAKEYTLVRASLPAVTLKAIEDTLLPLIQKRDASFKGFKQDARTITVPQSVLNMLCSKSSSMLKEVVGAFDAVKFAVFVSPEGTQKTADLAREKADHAAQLSRLFANAGLKGITADQFSTVKTGDTAPDNNGVYKHYVVLQYSAGRIF